MDSTTFQHSEAFLQWIWQNLLFDFNNLQTADGRALQIIDPGTLNSTDGPDFTHGIISLDGVTWHGDIELHLHASGWKEHGHHTDSRFNNVVLHVLTEGNDTGVLTENGHTPFTLNISPYLSDKVHQFLHSFRQGGSLNCASSFQFISEEAFYSQLEKAHREYFEKKADDFLQFYDPDLVPSKAWKHALILSLWDGLGISHNRQPMQQVARWWLRRTLEHPVFPTLSSTLNYAGLKGMANPEIHWNFKGVRPASHPRKRINEAVLLSKSITNLSFESFLSSNATKFWKQLLKQSGIHNTARYHILFGTVFLPALYMLGNLFAHHRLSENVFAQWKDLKTPVPRSILKSFQALSLSSNRYKKKLGVVHQLKAYCKPGKCSECFVLKKAIQS